MVGTDGSCQVFSRLCRTLLHNAHIDICIVDQLIPCSNLDCTVLRCAAPRSTWCLLAKMTGFRRKSVSSEEVSDYLCESDISEFSSTTEIDESEF
jgi:hypothetical protein